MPIDRAHGLLFIHIPKTAGTSVEELLDLRGDWRRENLDTCFGFIQSESLLAQQFSSHFLQHLTLTELQQLFADDVDAWALFAVVRDPWHRLLSSFRRKDPDLCACYRECFGQDLQDLGLEAYIELAKTFDHPHLRAQSLFVQNDASGKIDARVKIFQQEHLQDLEVWLSDVLGFKLKLPHRNVNVPQTPLPQLAASTWQRLQARVHELYAQDYEAFGYE